MSRSSPIVDSVRQQAIEWFSGKERQNAEHAFDLLADCESSAEWLPGASRRVEAALSKLNVARKLYTKYGKQLDAIGDYNTPREKRGWEVAFLLQYGNWKRGRDIDFDAVRAGAPNVEVLRAVDLARKLVEDFAPLIPLMDALNDTRPAPVFTSVGASPTITKLLTSLGLLLNISTIRMPPIEWRVVEKKYEDGRRYFAKVGTLQWPPGTAHNTSRYSLGTECNSLCHACGHAIKNAFNWVPIIIDDDVGVPHSLWVGRDCAESLFGIRVKGDVELDASSRKRWGDDSHFETPPSV